MTKTTSERARIKNEKGKRKKKARIQYSEDSRPRPRCERTNPLPLLSPITSSEMNDMFPMKEVSSDGSVRFDSSGLKRKDM